jgi:hypothetical protein
MTDLIAAKIGGFEEDKAHVVSKLLAFIISPKLNGKPDDAMVTSGAFDKAST